MDKPTIESDGRAVTNAQVVADLAQQAQGVFFEEETPFVIRAPGHTVESVERFSATPARERGTTTLDDMESFITYALSNEAGELYWQATETSATFQHVINASDWRDLRAVYKPSPSPAWSRWTKNNGQRKGQSEFAAFIEDNSLDIIEPAAADMIEISRSLEAKKSVNFASSIRLSNGQQELTYEEQIDGTAAKGKLRIPETFALGIPVFVGGVTYRVEARLRYRIDGGKLAMWYDMIRPHLVIADAVQTMVDAIKEKVKLPIYRGELGPIAP